MAIFLHKPILGNFTIVGPLIWCDNPQVRLWMISNINNNDFHQLGKSQICAGADHYFSPSKPHSGKLCIALQHSASKFVTQLGDQSGVILNVIQIHATSTRQTQFSVDLLDVISTHLRPDERWRRGNSKLPSVPDSLVTVTFKLNETHLTWPHFHEDYLLSILKTDHCQLFATDHL